MHRTFPVRLIWPAVLAPAACAAPEQEDFGGGSGSGGVGGDASLCPAGMVVGSEEGVTATSLGESDPSVLEAFPGTVLPLYSTSLEPYCIGAFPLPGQLGDDYLSDGLNVGQAEGLDELLTAYGRRVCTVSELLFAAAGPDNLRYPYGPDYDASACGTEAFFPPPLGARPDCVSPSGARDFGVRSSWAFLDADAYDAVAPTIVDGEDIPSAYAVYGGTAQRDTFFAPSNFGIHFYGPDDYSAEVPAYVTDDVRVCADLGTLDSETEAEWAAFVSELAAGGTYRAALGAGLDFSR